MPLKHQVPCRSYSFSFPVDQLHALSCVVTVTSLPLTCSNEDNHLLSLYIEGSPTIIFAASYSFMHGLQSQSETRVLLGLTAPLCSRVWLAHFTRKNSGVFSVLFFFFPENSREVIFLISFWRFDSVNFIVACVLVSIYHFEVVNDRWDTLR